MTTKQMLNPVKDVERGEALARRVILACTPGILEAETVGFSWDLGHPGLDQEPVSKRKSLRMWAGEDITQHNKEISLKITQNFSMTQPSYFLVYVQRKWNPVSRRSFDSCGLHSIIHRRWDMEATWVPVTREMGKETVRPTLRWTAELPLVCEI